MVFDTSQVCGGYRCGKAAFAAATVFVRPNLYVGEPHYTPSRVALNDFIMVFAFPPLVEMPAMVSFVRIIKAEEQID